MIDVATTWQQACTALAAGDYDAAFGILEAASREVRTPDRGRLALYLASIHALYGDTATVETRAALQLALRYNPALQTDPLWQALNAELEARTLDGQATPPTAAVREAGEALARFHALCALALGGDPQAALDVHVTPRTCRPTCAGGCAAGRQMPTSSWDRAPRRCICMPRLLTWPVGLTARSCCRSRRHCSCSRA
ncbi:hypothetical protein ACFSC4_13670 [Deinococcus malanensis]|uniref:hypothetical protein n=1 Tax=Deinococcus malanensis TaxID=1706855 RepID=UPI003629DDD1